MLDITIPGRPPSGNHLHVSYGASGMRGLSHDARKWQALAARAIRAAIHAQGLSFAPRVPLLVEVYIDSPRVYTWDLDNHLKALGDALSAALEVNDRYFQRWIVEKQRGPVEQTRIVVRVYTPGDAR